ncbi:14072_t:CDS:2 [Funneliformis caledonium]|uniref:14072_t:CDS:1 n=1 Tax=Funneliformis caledonium TaxID=1117310 RepID=A0A9N8V477_9GLOM|nr:14072_t:CDS:2 [Funneliformis caledonium]
MDDVNLSDFVPVIRQILYDSNLDSITAREVRRELEKKYDLDLTPRKQEVQRLVEQCFDDLSNSDEIYEPVEFKSPKKQKKHSNHSEEKTKKSSDKSSRKILKTKGRPSKTQVKTQESDYYSSLEDDFPPQKKRRGRKPKVSSKVESSDAEYEKRFEEELNGANVKKSKARNSGSTTKKKSSKRKKRDEEEQDGEEPKKRKKGNTGIHKPLILSQVLAEFLQAEEMSRLEVVKRLWAYIKENELQDPSDKRFIVCDDRLMTIFNQDRIHSFTMNKFLTVHLKKKEISSDGNVKNINGTSKNYRKNETSSSVSGYNDDDDDDQVKIEPQDYVKVKTESKEDYVKVKTEPKEDYVKVKMEPQEYDVKVKMEPQEYDVKMFFSDNS